MILVSLDTSTTSTGYAVYDNGELVKYGCLKHDTKKRIATNEKMINMVMKIYELLNDIKPDFVITELTAVARNVQVQRNLTMILGAIMGYCISHNAYYYSFRPTEWRSLISDKNKPRKREELKQWSKDQVKQILNIELDSDDISDAVLIGYAYYMAFGKEYIKHSDTED